MRILRHRSGQAFITALACSFALPALAQDAGTVGANEDPKILYTLGFDMGQRLKGAFAPSPEEVAAIQRGMTDSANETKPLVDIQTYGQAKVGALQQARRAKITEDQKAKGKEFQDKAAAESGAKRQPDGLIYVELTAGSGDAPKPTDRVKVNYKGSLIDGTEFDSSYKRGQPAEFPLNGVVKCWTEGLQMMKVGGKAKLVCPSDIAYADRGQPPRIPGGATLVFEVELLGVTAAPPPGAPGAMPGRFPQMTVDAGSSMSFKPKGCGCGEPGLAAWGAAAVAGLLARRRRRASAKTSTRKDALMRTLLLTALAALVALPAFAADEFKNEEEKSFYAIGYNIGQNMASNFAPTKAELEILKRGLADGANGAKAEVTVEEESPKWAAFQQKRRAGIIEDQKAKGAAYLAKAAKEKGAKKLESGLVYIEEKAGSGEHPKPTDKVKVHYKGTLINGLEFDSSYSRGQPAEFPLGGVVKCWTEGLQKMKVGGKAKLVCPAEIAYADRGQPPRIPGGATLVFEVELLGISAAPPPNMPGPGPMTMPPHPPIPPPQQPPAPKQ